MKLGARSLKTGLAVALAIIISQLLMPGTGVIAGICAVGSTQPSVARSYKNLRQRLIANTIGGILAAVIVGGLGTNVIIIGLSSVLLISILNYLKLGNVISQSVVTMVIIMMSSGSNLYLNSAMRIAETFIGVIVAFLVNTLIHPPKYGEPLYHTIDYATSEFLVWLRAGLRKNIEFSTMNKDLNWARQQLNQMETYFQFLQESKLSFRRYRYKEMRLLVIFRRMIACARAAYKILVVMHDHENVFSSFPREMRVTIRERLETLMSGHEQIMLKFIGRVPANQVNFFEAKREERTELLRNFFEHTKQESDDEDFSIVGGYGAIHLMSAILAYEDELVRFNKLVTHYRRYTKANNIEYLDNINH